jgi:uncharacterized protein Yka (UPF0111/DUF47 family)
MKKDRRLSIFTPKYYSLFPFFESIAQNLVTAAELLKELLTTQDPEKKAEIINRIIELEKTGNLTARETYSLLNSLFIIPFDREDISKLVNRADDVLDSINRVGKIVHFSKSYEKLPVYIEIAGVIYLASYEIGKCFMYLKDANNNKDKIMKGCGNLNQLDEKASEIFDSGLAELFTTRKEIAELSKEKQLFETLHRCMIEIESVTESFETILIKIS